MRIRLLALVAIVAVVSGAAWWLWIGSRAEPSVGACASAERAEDPDAPVVFEPTIHWELASLPPHVTDANEQVMLAATSMDHGWVAAGRTSTGPTSHGFTLVSVDGATWGSDPGDAVQFKEAEIDHMAEFGGRVVASGSVHTGTVRTGVWVNHFGVAWQAARGSFDASWPTALAAGDRSLLMLGTADASGAPLAWTSDEGSVWERVDVRLPVAPDLASFSAVRADGEGWLAIGSLSRGVDQPAWPVAWSSPDGVTWRCLLLDRAGFDVATPTALHRSAQGWLAVGIAADLCGFGGSCPGSAIAWTSPDGVRWSPGITGGEPWHTGGIAVAGSAEGFVAVGHGTTWWSADGNAWVEVADGGSGAEALIGEPDALVMTDRGQLAVSGTTYDGTDADAWIATGVLQR